MKKIVGFSVRHWPKSYRLSIMLNVLGPSSNIAFMHYISRVVARANSQNQSTFSLPPPEPRRGGMVNVSRSQRASVGSADLNMNLPAPTRVNIYALPSAERTWSLIQQYFQKTGQLLPFIHEASFCKTYFQMKRENFKKVRRTWLGLLNIVLAITVSLSAENDIPAELRIRDSDIYYQRANGLCDRESKRNASLEMGMWKIINGIYLYR